MVHIDLQGNATFAHYLPLQSSLDNCIVYVFRGAGSICGSQVPASHVIHLDATDTSARAINFIAG